MKRAKKFVFDGILLTNDRKQVNFTYHAEFEDSQPITFSESLEFEQSLPNSEIIDNTLHFYHIAAGVSYYKAHLAPEIASHGLDPWAAEAMTDIYHQGLGEFLYMNDLSVNDLARFAPEQSQELPTTEKSVNSDNWLVPIGGGKDSLVTTTILEQLDRDFDAFRVNSNDWVDRQLLEIGAPTQKVRRTFDYEFFASNHPQFKGHVPVTVIIAAAAVIVAVANGHSSVVFSNESSADEPTLTDYKGLNINHQWAKSSEAERLIKRWVSRYISADLEVFSLLRNMSELDIAEVFAKAALPRYGQLWSSSNSNFRQDSPGKLDWDLTSPKTCTVFLLLAPFVDREVLIEEFGGNPFLISDNHENWSKLLGKTEAKPFECVATVEEMRQALEMAKPKWPELKKIG